MIVALVTWYLLLDIFCARDKITIFLAQGSLVVLDHPVATEFLVLAIVKRVLVCFVIMMHSHEKTLGLFFILLLSCAELLNLLVSSS